MWNNKLNLCLLLVLSVTLLGCPNEGTVSESSTTVNFKPPPEGTVCNPFQGGNAIGPQYGIQGSLFYRGASDPTFNGVSDYINMGHPIENAWLFFDQLYIPTRPFDRGFVTQSGEQILTPEGNSLYEWFAVRYKGRFASNESNPPGYYEFAVLSDDGSILTVDQGNGQEVVVSNDGNHPTRMGCASRPVYVDSAMPASYVLDYYQGPRFHIALVVMMRPWVDNNTDPSCGTSGNSLFFDSTQNPPAPQAAYNNLLARGWKPLDQDNYLLPQQGQSNPCNQAPPVISNAQIIGTTQTTVTMSWDTDIASTSKLVYTRVSNGVVVETPVNNTLVTSHSLTASGLLSNTLYNVKAVSTSTSGQSAESIEVQFRTLR